jgi:hypothetical protein
MKPFQLVSMESSFGAPIVQVCIGDYTSEGKTIFITQQCANLTEFEYAIGQLHKELDAIKAQGRRKFNAAT